jgi:hypothetical protein
LGSQHIGYVCFHAQLLHEDLNLKQLYLHCIALLSPGQTRKHCCGNIVSYQCFAMFPRVGKH